MAYDEIKGTCRVCVNEGGYPNFYTEDGKVVCGWCGTEKDKK